MTAQILLVGLVLELGACTLPPDHRSPPEATDAAVVDVDRSRDQEVERAQADATADLRADLSAPDMESCAVPRVSAPGVVRTTRGLVQGKPSGGTTAFLGIPYAEPPVGSLRWRPPVPRACWWNVKDATSYGQRCPQISYLGQFVGQEDCLFLNVWTPTPPGAGSTLLPVMVFIHGGGFASGSNNEGLSSVIGRAAGGVGNLYDGRRLAENNNAVVVTINYRLGALGFLAHPALSQESPDNRSGNYGLMDAIAALTWVQQNIQAFGGDPSRVLVFGESAGAIMTCMLLVSPAAKGLFHAALMQSGTCDAPSLATREQQGTQAAQQVGCTELNSAASCLRGQSAEAMAKLFTGDVDFFKPGFDYKDPWGILDSGPGVDGQLIPDAPMALISAGKHNRVPFAIGTNAEETELFVPSSAFKSCTDYETKVQQMLGPLAGAALGLYPCTSYTAPSLAAVDLSTDLAFTCNTRRIARAVAGAQTEPVFRYLYTHRYKNSPLGWLMHAFHASELPTVFQTFSNIAYFPSKSEVALSDAIQAYWYGLAATGSPQASPGPAWPPYLPADDNLLVLDDTIAPLAGYKGSRCDYWDTVATP